MASKTALLDVNMLIALFDIVVNITDKHFISLTH